MGASGLGSISRVDQNSLEQQFTATDLIGKEVYDNAGKKVGDVKDIVLGSAAGSHLAMAFASGQGSRSTSTGTTSGSTTGTAGTSSTGSSYGATGSTGTTGSTAGTSTGSTSGSRTAGTSGSTGTSSTDRSSGIGAAASGMMSQAHGAMSSLTSEPAAIVSVGGFMGMGDNLLRVPLSQLNYDSSNERLTLSISETEISSLTGDRDESRNAAE